MQFLPQALLPLANYKQFILVKLVWSPEEGKFLKFPWAPFSDYKINAHDPKNWMGADEVFSIIKQRGVEFTIGFVFTENDPFFFLDIDSCLQEDNTWSDLAVQLLTQFAGAAVEISCSQRALHVIGTYSQRIEHECKHPKLKIELYTEGRFVALTGIQPSGTVLTDCTPALITCVNEYFSITNSPMPTPHIDSVHIDDDTIIHLLHNQSSAKAAFGGAASIQQLWTADEALAQFYRKADGSFDPSSADFALAWNIAFYTRDEAQIERIMRRSALVRDKWDRPDYWARTLGRALQSQQGVYKGAAKPIAPPPTSETTQRQAAPFITLEAQVELFKDCIYIADERKILTPGGLLLGPDSFNEDPRYAGRRYVLSLDGTRIAKKAWEGFTQYEAGPLRQYADSSYFNPLHPPLHIDDSKMLKRLNLWQLPQVKRTKGDVSPFINHLKKLFPDPVDYQIVINYLAACVQRYGRRIRWCIVIQGIEGNGKTMIVDWLSYAIDEDYCNTVRADQIASRFNTWIDKKLLVCVNDFHKASTRAEAETVLEIMKPLISDSKSPIEAKGKDQKTKEIFANFIINTNNKDSLFISNKTRRYAVFFTPQQEIEDLQRDGMDDNYFQTLSRWSHSGGNEIVADFLATYPIAPEYDPHNFARAPSTSSKAAAINLSFSTIEQLIFEAIESDQIGFKNGWTTSSEVNHYLQTKGYRVGPNQIKPLMDKLGYIAHPGLKDGRSTSIIAPHSNRPRMYIRKNHIHMNLTDHKQIIDEFVESQK